MASRLRERSIATLHIPTGYAFRINGKIAEPNLMQRLAAVQVRDKKRVGNWSGTGAGKTLSAVLASRVINAHLTVICCPNSVVDGWEKAILDIFPDSVVAKKTFTPDWKPNPPAPFPAREGGAKLLSSTPRVKGGKGGSKGAGEKVNFPAKEKNFSPLLAGEGLGERSISRRQRKRKPYSPLLAGEGLGERSTITSSSTTKCSNNPTQPIGFAH